MSSIEDRMTSNRADAFVRRQAIWSRLLDLFRHDRPTEDQLAQVSTLSEVAIEQVFSAHHLSQEQQEAQYSGVKDFAECSALYGYVLGYHQGRAAAQQQSNSPMGAD